MSVMCEANQKTHPWCKVCLVSNVRMCSIENLQILEIYGKLTNTQQIQDEMPQALCYICYSLLQKAHRFADMAHKSQNILEDMRRQGVEVHAITIMPNFGFAPNLSATDISVTSIPNYTNTQLTEEHTAVKVEPKCEVEEIIETEEIYTVLEEEEIFENFIDKRHNEKKILLETGRTKICNKTLSHQASLQNHIRTHNGEKPHVCNICSKSFYRSNDLLNHTRTHTGEKPYVCNICSKSFYRQDLLKRHTRTHTGEKPYECKICNKTFSQQAALKCHLRTHTGKRPHVCYICSKSFIRPMCLRYHMRTHTGEKPYDCNICSKSFSRQDHLQRHMRTHTGEKPHVCNICSMLFSRQESLQRHMRRCTHTGDK